MSNTGWKYIHKNQFNGKYQVKIWVYDRTKNFGSFHTLEEAIKQRTKVMEELGLELHLDK